MSDLDDMAPAAKERQAKAKGKLAGIEGDIEQAALEDQIAQLQSDLKGIATTLARLTEQRASEVRHEAEAGVNHLVRQGQHAIDEVSEQASALETSLKQTVREKPLTSIAGAVGIGFLLALLTRR